MHAYIYIYIHNIYNNTRTHIYIYIINKYLLLGVIIYNLIDYIYIYVYISQPSDAIQSLYFGSKLPSSETY